HIVNLELAVKYQGLPKRLFSTNYPPHNLLKSYLRRGGSVEETLGMVSAVENLLRAAGRTAAYVRKIPLPGGRNNRVWRLNTAEGPLLLKEYFQEDDWDRLAAESRFLRFCARAGVSRVPRLLAEDAKTGLALHGWLSGDRLDPEKLGESDVAEAAAFLAELAAVSRNSRAAEMPPARDACLRLDDFFRSPRQRLADLEKALLEQPETALTREARRFLRDNLRPAWEQARAAVMADLAGKDLQQPFPDDMLMFSPSDAGFHNALRLKGDGLAFVDFEYAGLDSPAKLLGDFVSQPDFPPPAGTLDALATALADNAAAGGELAGLVGLLMPLFRIKFCCIILNDFKMLDAERRDFAEGGRQASRLEGQLARAKSYLSSSRLCGDDLN
ncbi:MAG: aminoglycoside phosphotransferase family protein, partial [Planctomycetota bacterium]|nr:aminoglycoside phosphotransferase family protein [Planctomycetota bacterium]